MRHRSQKLGLMHADNPTGLAVPVNVWDGNSFPSCISHIHNLDCRRYIFTGKCFEDSDLFLDFQQTLQAWVPKVAGLIRNPPEWNSDWATPEWLEAPYEDLLIPPPRIGPPRMI